MYTPNIHVYKIARVRPGVLLSGDDNPEPDFKSKIFCPLLRTPIHANLWIWMKS